MFTALLSFFIGVLILLLSTNYLVKASVMLAHKLHLSPLIIGITIVSLGTSLPELVVSLVASLKGDYGLALGNIVGSNISNILLVLAVAIILGGLRVGTTKSQKTILVLVGTTFLFSFFHLFQISNLVSGVFLLSLGMVITILEYYWGRKGSLQEDFARINKKTTNTLNVSTIPLLVVSLVGTTLGGIILVSSTESLALLLAVSTTVLGLSLIAVSTSLPELLTVIFSQRKGQEKLSLGTVIGSNIYNLALIGGLVSLASDKVTLPILDWGWFLGITLILLVIVRTLRGMIIPRLIGLLLLLLFWLYIFAQTL